MLLFVYTTTRKRFVIFTCRYFKLTWNTTALSQSNFRNFSCSGIRVVTRHQYRISQLIPQSSFCGKTSGGFAKCRLFSQVTTKLSVTAQWSKGVLEKRLQGAQKFWNPSCSLFKWYANSKISLMPYWWKKIARVHQVLPECSCGDGMASRRLRFTIVSKIFQNSEPIPLPFSSWYYSNGLKLKLGLQVIIIFLM